ncbi:hypothetical protein [Stenotrophomonas sp. 24(2023)]|uniref:hypothetical protein n=1 Tax=Stenotrophomonas sp. 24(2023) TaxID=3068324 RepID=UPI0027E0BA26|nr:hypothetical protein [Stenotrophomonas sp. 24(2023)]WMJ68074.1 hypothetical protein Q9R17_12790 [Stenotrophomonas sp. 24(2023)]
MTTASQLIHTHPGADGNERTYLELSDGRKLPLPFHWRNEELLLPGNFAEVGAGPCFALFDDSTRSGLIYCGAATTPYWNVFQPCTREVFFDELVPQAMANIEAINERFGKAY